MLDLYFLEARARLIDLAAFLDRVEHVPGEGVFRFGALRMALEEMVRQPAGTGGRVEGVLMALSDPTGEPLAAATAKSAVGAWAGVPA